MVRLLLIRHGESAQNRHQSHLAAPSAATAADFNRAMRAESSEEDGDVALTEVGQHQAQLLADVWVPLLQQKARERRLHVYVSPMRRTLQTADPMMRALHASCGQYAKIHPRIMEFGGLAAPGDLKVLDQADVLRRKGDQTGAKTLLKSFQWQPCGFTGSDLLQDYPWAQLPADFPMEKPWWAEGFEGSKKNRARIATLMEEIASFRHTCGEGDLIVFVSHGGTIGDVLYRLLVRQAPSTSLQETREEPNFETVDNTSVTSVLLPGKKFPFTASPRAADRLLAFGCRLEFMNNTAHLGMSKLHDWASANAVLPAKSKL